MLSMSACGAAVEERDSTVWRGGEVARAVAVQQEDRHRSHGLLRWTVAEGTSKKQGKEAKVMK